MPRRSQCASEVEPIAARSRASVHRFASGLGMPGRLTLVRSERHAKPRLASAISRARAIGFRSISRLAQAEVKRRGGLPKAHFTLLDVVRRTRRKRAFTSRGNLIGAPAPVAFVERDLVITFITKQLRCSCGGRLAYVRQLSTQVGVCAAWKFTCERA